jgi:multiple sugar transport system permease protein/putative aldouronate transport system permease protein
MDHSGSIRKIKGDRSFHMVNFVLLTFIMLIVLYPLIYVISCSFSSAYAVVTNRVWFWPVDITFDGYKAVFEHPLIMTGYMNSLIYMVFGTMVNVILLVLCGYPLSRKDLPGAKFWIIYCMLTMFFNGGKIPNYLLVKNLGLINTSLALIIPFAFSAYNMVIVRPFFKSNLP